jgi:hypothetical protein
VEDLSGFGKVEERRLSAASPETITNGLQPPPNLLELFFFSVPKMWVPHFSRDLSARSGDFDSFLSGALM